MPTKRVRLATVVLLLLVGAAVGLWFARGGLIGERGGERATVADRATFEDPMQFPVGVRDVFVGGEPVVAGGEMTGRRPGIVVS